VCFFHQDAFPPSDQAFASFGSPHAAGPTSADGAPTGADPFGADPFGFPDDNAFGNTAFPPAQSAFPASTNFDDFGAANFDAKF
jgi:hypothetical protein